MRARARQQEDGGDREEGLAWQPLLARLATALATALASALAAATAAATALAAAVSATACNAPRDAPCKASRHCLAAAALGALAVAALTAALRPIDELAFERCAEGDHERLTLDVPGRAELHGVLREQGVQREREAVPFEATLALGLFSVDDLHLGLVVLAFGLVVLAGVLVVGFVALAFGLVVLGGVVTCSSIQSRRPAKVLSSA